MRELCFNSGTMSTVQAGSLTSSFNLALFVAAVVWPLGRWKILVDASLVGVNSSPMRPQWEVAPESNTAVDVLLMGLVLLMFAMLCLRLICGVLWFGCLVAG